MDKFIHSFKMRQIYNNGRQNKKKPEVASITSNDLNRINESSSLKVS